MVKVKDDLGYVYTNFLALDASINVYMNSINKSNDAQTKLIANELYNLADQSSNTLALLEAIYDNGRKLMGAAVVAKINREIEVLYDFIEEGLCIEPSIEDNFLNQGTEEYRMNHEALNAINMLRHRIQNDFNDQFEALTVAA